MNRLNLNFKDPKGNLKTGVLEVKNQNNKSQFYIFGDISSDSWDKWTDEDTCPSDVLNLLNSIDGDLDIYINSPGGSAYAGVAIYNMLKRYDSGKITVYVEGIAASAASIIAMAGDEIIIPKNACLMIHKAWSYGYGNSNDLIDLAEQLERLDEVILGTYKEKLKDGNDLEKIKEMVTNETFIYGEEAAKYFNITVEKELEAVACLDKTSLNDERIPENIRKIMNFRENKKNKNEVDVNLEIEKAKLKLKLNLL